MSHYLIIDGGTTNLRVTLTDLQGRILDGEKRMAGAAQSAEEKSNACLQAAVRESIAADRSTTKRKEKREELPWQKHLFDRRNQ